VTGWRPINAMAMLLANKLRSPPSPELLPRLFGAKLSRAACDADQREELFTERATRELSTSPYWWRRSAWPEILRRSMHLGMRTPAN